MERLTRLLSAAFVGVAGLLLVEPAQAAAQAARVSPASLQARAVSGSISGLVLDDRGGAVPGAMVSALGATLASAVTDETGRFRLSGLPAGEYLLRAHMKGFAASSGSVVRVGLDPAVHSLQLRRLEVGAGAPAAGGPVKARPIFAAGFDLPRGGAAEAEPGEAEAGADTPADHPHTETAWRLRHVPRSILRDAAPILVLADGEAPPSASLFGRAVGSAAHLATTFFSDFPFSGEVNFLTTGAVAPGAVFSATGLPRGVAYLALSAPAPGGDWSIRAAMSEGDLSSWIVAGAFTSRPGKVHDYDFGLTYSTQEYIGGNPSALAAVSDGTRNVGEVYGFDRWAVSPGVTFEYGARYARYDYLEQRGLLSPRIGVTLEPFGRTRIRGSVGQRMLAPGAEEFLSSSSAGPWLPPERTFAPLGGRADGEALRVERSRSYDIGVERVLPAEFVLGLSRFHQSVDDQLVTLFGLQPLDGPRSVGHYYVASAGAVETDGWTLRFETPASSRLQGSVHYSVARARWTTRSDLSGGVSGAGMLRPDTEDLHDLTSSVHANIPETATRVFLLYKVNTGYARSPERAGLDGRFDVQVNQALPLAFAGTKWEVLVGLRNLFRDPTDTASVYDELLVVRPPTRLVGGVLVRF